MSDVVQLSRAENRTLTLAPYKAFEVGSKRLRKMLLYDADENIIGLPSYSHYVDGLCTSPHYLWLLYSVSAFCIKGRNLPGDLLTLFVDDRLKALYCFNSARHIEVASDALQIDSITRHSLKEFMLEQKGGIER